MNATINLIPARNFGPGYFIQKQLDFRHWTQNNLAQLMDVDPQLLNDVILNKYAITRDIVTQLSKVFETSIQYWLNLDATFRLWLENRSSAIQ